MLARFLYRITGLGLFTALLWTVQAANAGTPSAAEYLALKKSLGAVPLTVSTPTYNNSPLIGKTLELKGSINGIVKCGESHSFIINSAGESLVVKARATLPNCIANGNTVRVLVKVGPGSVASLSDLELLGAAFDYEISAKEKELAPKRNANKTPSTPVKGDRGPKSLASRHANPAGPAWRTMQAKEIYQAYRKAIARFNPRLSNRQLDEITTSILSFSSRYQIDPRLIVAIFLVESGFKPNATSPKGAMGLGQLMPGTARGLGVGNAYDPVQNVEASIRLIRGHIDKYDGDLALALSAYNAGPGAVRKYGGVPPYRETRNYVRKVSQYYKALCGER